MTVVPRLQLERAIMFECGTDPKTMRNNKNALKKLGWIVFHRGSDITLTDNDLSEG